MSGDREAGRTWAPRQQVASLSGKTLPAHAETLTQEVQHAETRDEANCWKRRCWLARGITTAGARSP
eukprot:3105772-Rhodomonas_salina.1